MRRGRGEEGERRCVRQGRGGCVVGHRVGGSAGPAHLRGLRGLRGVMCITIIDTLIHHILHILTTHTYYLPPLSCWRSRDVYHNNRHTYTD
jgi:hypothetical protein